MDQRHGIDFFVYFPVEKEVRLVATAPRKKGFEIELHSLPDKKQWSCCTAKEMIPTSEEIHTLRFWFETLTEELGGTSDSWGTSVID